MRTPGMITGSGERAFVRGALSTFCLLLVVAVSGCRSVKITEPARTAGEQLLLSTAVDRALMDVDLSSLHGRKVYVEEKYFESYDKHYALGSVRELICRSGAVLTQAETNAEVIVEVRSGGLGLDTADTLIGIPTLGVPIPLTGVVQTPELALFKKQKTDSLAKFALFARERMSGSQLHSSGPMAGKAYLNQYKLLGFMGWRRTDVPEFRSKSKKRDDTPPEKPSSR